MTDHFTKQNRDIISLILAYLQNNELANLQSTCSSLKSDVKYYHRNALQKQIQFWSILLPNPTTHIISDNYLYNYNLLERMDVLNIDNELTDEEKTEWYTALDSLEYPPNIELTDQDENLIIKKALPIFHKNSNRLGLSDNEQVVSMRYKSYLEINGDPNAENTANPYGFLFRKNRIDSITSLAIVEASFIDVLKIFTIDSKRNNIWNKRSIAEIALIRLTKGDDDELELTNDRNDENKNLLLLILAIRSLGKTNTFLNVYNQIHNEWLFNLTNYSSAIRALLLAGYNFEEKFNNKLCLTSMISLKDYESFIQMISYIPKDMFIRQIRLRNIDFLQSPQYRKDLLHKNAKFILLERLKYLEPNLRSVIQKHLKLA